MASIAGGTESECITGSEVVTANSETRSASKMTHTGVFAYESAHLIFVPVLKVKVGGSTGSTVSKATDVVIETTITEDSNTMFHLEDPDQGDYFVVSVWSEYVSRAVQF